MDTNSHDFVATSPFAPVTASRPGIYVCGAMQGPKDIPESVMQASAAAGAVSATLGDVRWTETKTRQAPTPKDIKPEDAPRIGVFVCNCGINIGGIIDVPELAEYAKTLPNVAYVEDNLFTCSQDTQVNMTRIIEEHNLNRVVVAACTPITHEPLFRETLIDAGLNKYLFEMANIRNQDSWVHMKEHDKATDKAKDLVRMAVARASLLKPLLEKPLTINQRALVIGGGIAGLNAALNLGTRDSRPSSWRRSRSWAAWAAGSTRPSRAWTSRPTWTGSWSGSRPTPRSRCSPGHWWWGLAATKATSPRKYWWGPACMSGKSTTGSPWWPPAP